MVNAERIAGELSPRSFQRGKGDSRPPISRPRKCLSRPRRSTICRASAGGGGGGGVKGGEIPKSTESTRGVQSMQVRTGPGEGWRLVCRACRRGGARGGGGANGRRTWAGTGQFERSAGRDAIQPFPRRLWARQVRWSASRGSTTRSRRKEARGISHFPMLRGLGERTCTAASTAQAHTHTHEMAADAAHLPEWSAIGGEAHTWQMVGLCDVPCCCPQLHPSLWLVLDTCCQCSAMPGVSLILLPLRKSSDWEGAAWTDSARADGPSILWTPTVQPAAVTGWLAGVVLLPCTPCFAGRPTRRAPDTPFALVRPLIYCC